VDKTVKIKSRRLNRFVFEPVRDILARQKKSPELKRRLKEDLPGTLQAEGIVVDDAFRKAISEKWHARISEDVHSVMEKVPDERKPYYRMVRDGKPIRVRVTINRKDGTITVKPGEESP